MREAKDAEGHEHKGKGPGGGQFTSGAGQGGSGGKKQPGENDPVHDYLAGFADKSQEPATAKDARAANRDLKGEGSRFRIVPDGKGGWQASHVGDLVDEFGADWIVAVNPLTGLLDVGSKGYFDEVKPFAGDVLSQSYVHAFNDPSAEPATEKESEQANRELEGDGSRFRIEKSENYGLWIAKPVRTAPQADTVKESLYPSGTTIICYPAAEPSPGFDLRE